LDMVYVVDERNALLDDLRLRLFVLGDPTASVASIMDHHFVALRVTDDRHEAVRLMTEQKRVALPVVGADGILVGIVTVRGVRQVAERQATAESQRLGGSEALEAPYMKIGLAGWSRNGPAGSRPSSSGRCSRRPRWATSRTKSPRRWCLPFS